MTILPQNKDPSCAASYFQQSINRPPGKSNNSSHFYPIKTNQLSKQQLSTHQNSSFPFSPPPMREILATCPDEEGAMAK
ncbi:hypothetical protein AV530_010944 [Patagioenas fasciata monilis]|uniref:Uncharacterized protein n=1 Tax=Patagioenas fasciata monilis TaxID=372326 RepID=A0A1V4K8B9_PATFA|nr:hypothetical protein AV530_010944 [Patagioenas fasciata monilis]